jgi:hypothetical protein
VKRDARLRDLSDDHHTALVLAVHARRAGRGAGETVDAAALWRAFRRRFDAELEPHFAIEDDLLVPALDAAGLGTLAGRIRADHAALRALAGKEARDGAEAVALLRETGALLEAHVRFEEREAFEAAQRALPDAALDAIASATRARDAQAGRPPPASTDPA